MIYHEHAPVFPRPMKKILPAKPQYADLEDLVGKTTLEVIEYFAEQIYFERVLVPTTIVTRNIFSLLFRLYRRGDLHLQHNESRSLEDISNEPEFALGLGDVFSGILRDIVGGVGERSDFNCIGFENRVEMYNRPYSKYELDYTHQFYFGRSPIEMAFIALGDADELMVSNVPYVGWPGCRQVYLLLIDFLVPATSANIEVIKAGFQRRIFDQGMFVEGVLVRSSDRGMHFIGTNPLMSRKQFDDIRRFVLQFDAINDPEHSIRVIDTHHLYTHFENCSRTGVGKRRYPPDWGRSNALRINGVDGRTSNEVVAVVRPGQAFVHLDASDWCPYKVQMKF